VDNTTLESVFETNSGGLRRAAGLYIPAQSGICNSGDSGHEPKGASEKLGLGIPVRKLPSAEGSYGGTAQSCDLGSRNRDADGSVASNAPACSDFGDGFLSESTNEDQSLWCAFIESNPQLIEEEDHIRDDADQLFSRLGTEQTAGEGGTQEDSAR
jgi:hypothetical protein